MASDSFRFQRSMRRSSAAVLLVPVAVAAFALVLHLAPVYGQQPAPAATPAMPDPTILFNQALTAFDRGDFEACLTTIDTLLKSIPSDLPDTDKAKLVPLLEPIYFTRGAAYFNLKKYSDAITAIKDYFTRYPKSTRVAETTFSLAQADFFTEDFAEAAKNFATLESNPAYREEALLYEGLSYRKGNQNAKSIGAFEKLTNGGIKTPTAARAAMQLVTLYAEEKHPDKALKMISTIQANIDQLENVVELNAVALTQGDAFLENNQNQEALTCYRAVRTREQVIALERDRIAALQRRLDAIKVAVRADPKSGPKYFRASKQLQESIAEDQQLVDDFAKLPTIYPKVLYRMARAFYQETRPWEAMVAYRDSFDRSTDPADREPALYGVITCNADVNQPAAARLACNQYLKEFPQGTNAFTVGYLLGATALQENDPKTAETYFGRMLVEQPASTLREEMEFLLGNAQFGQGKYDEAKASYGRYEKDFSNGTHSEEASYRSALSTLFAGNYDEASKLFQQYLDKNPSGNFVSDAKYRLAVCQYAGSKYDAVITATQAWLKQYPGDAQQGEVEALLGDAYVATGKTDDALAAYQISVKTATTAEVLNYALGEAGKILQKQGRWEENAAMYTDFVRTHPDSDNVVSALAQIGHSKVKEGKVDEAKQFLADTLKKYIDDPHRTSVEQILDQLAFLCARKKPVAVVAASPAPAASPEASPAAGIAAAAATASPSPGAPPAASPAASPVVAAAETPAPDASPAPDPGAELDTLLGASLSDRSPTAQARVLYAKAQLARLRRQPAEADRDLLSISTLYKPAVLSPTILGLVGDLLLSQGKLDEAAPFYQALMDNFPKDDNVDFSYAGLGEIAFQRKQYDKALTLFRDGTDKITANQKNKDLTVGQAKALLALGKLDEAKKIFQEAASVREWRGETTAFCMYSLGEIAAKKGDWAEANSYYQRVFVAYQRYLPWVAKAYLGSATALEKLGKKADAVKIYQEMLKNTKLADFSETATARERLQALGAG